MFVELIDAQCEAETVPPTRLKTTQKPPLTVGQIARRLGRHRDTVYTWINVGVIVGGERVRLVARRVGWRFAVKRRDLREFLAKCNGEPLEQSPARRKRSVRTATEARAAHAAAEFFGRQKGAGKPRVTAASSDSSGK